jgi:rsbT co-antagonist protein RsbR
MTEDSEFARLGELLSTQAEDLTTGWITAVTTSLRGRVSRAEIERELRELYGALEAALRRSQGRPDPHGEQFAEVRALLAELSRTRARQGFTPSETAVSVLALKGALEPLLGKELDAPGFRAYLQLSTLLDELGLFTVETYARAREELISAQAEQLLELSTPVVKLWDGVIAVPLVGTLDSARTRVVMEKMLQAPSSTSPGCRRSTPRSPSTC